jgi:hypothetical protein
MASESYLSLGEKMDLLKHPSPAWVVLALILLSGCQSTVYQTDGQRSGAISQDQKNPDQQIQSAPIDELSSTVPVFEPQDAKNTEVVEVMRHKTERLLELNAWQQAIDMAERGLRINRRYGYFYQAITEAYVGLGSMQKAIDFARLGLRYCATGSTCKAKLEYFLAGE